MSNRFDGKVILITGAGSGLGRVSALQVVKEGANVSLVDLNSEGLEETKKLDFGSIFKSRSAFNHCKRRG